MITSDEIARFANDGAILMKNIFSPKWVHIVEEGIRKVLEDPSRLSEFLVANEGTGAYFNDLDNWRRIQEFQDFVRNSPAAELVGKLIEAKKLTFFHEHVLIKEPGALSETPWHQDQPYYPVDGKVVSIWMPVDAVPMETTIQFIRGSHRWSSWYFPRKFATSNNYPVENDDLLSLKNWETLPDISSKLNDYEVLQWSVEPGDCVVFDGLTIHGAPANHLPKPRRVFSTRWLGDDAVYAQRAWTTSPPVVDDWKHLNFGDHFSTSGHFPVVWQSCL